MDACQRRQIAIHSRRHFNSCYRILLCMYAYMCIEREGFGTNLVIAIHMYMYICMYDRISKFYYISSDIAIDIL